MRLNMEEYTLRGVELMGIASMVFAIWAFKTQDNFVLTCFLVVISVLLYALPTTLEESKKKQRGRKKEVEKK